MSLYLRFRGSRTFGMDGVRARVSTGKPPYPEPHLYRATSLSSGYPHDYDDFSKFPNLSQQFVLWATSKSPMHPSHTGNESSVKSLTSGYDIISSRSAVYPHLIS